MRLLLGTHVRGGGGDSSRREAAAQASLAALAASGSVVAAILGFPDDPPLEGTLPRLSELRLEASRLTGVAGPRKPVITEMLGILAREADRRGITRIGVVNGDIVVTPQAVARTLESTYPAYAVSRTDIGGEQAEAPLLYGVDMVVFDVGFWRRERHRFRAYLLGDAVWDNVYASIIVCHGGALLNRERLIFHERHESASRSSVYARYTHLLAARDSAYFARWCRYVAEAERLRARGGTPEEELVLQRAVFVRPRLSEHAIDMGRAAWWRVKAAF